MRLTERDRKILWWANSCGYVSLSQLAAFMKVDFSTAARRARALCEGGMLSRHALPLATQTVVLPTKAACVLNGDFLSPINGIRLISSRHDSALIDCARALEGKFTGLFESERRLRQRRFSIDGHMPDGLLHRKNNELIAIELELSCKAVPRLKAIFDAYAANLEVSEVWYIVTDSTVESHLRRVIGDRSGIRIRRWVPNSADDKSDGDR